MVGEGERSWSLFRNRGLKAIRQNSADLALDLLRAGGRKASVRVSSGNRLGAVRVLMEEK